MSAQQSNSLKQWLEQPSNGPPTDLDDDVVEAVVALRPELAAAPRVSVDDILASITSGPLAAEPGGELVQFPVVTPPAPEEEAPANTPIDAEPARRRSSLWWLGGTGGAGILLASAATLFFAVQTNFDSEPAMAPGAADEIAAEMPPEPMEEAVAAADEAPMAEPPARSRQARSKPAAAAAPPPPVEQEIAYDMAERSNEPASDGIPELQAGKSLAESRKEALPDDRANGWQDGLSEDQRSTVEEAYASANEAASAGRFRDAADALALVVGPPANTGQAVAADAAGYYLKAGDAGAAASIATRGLGLSSANTPTRSYLLVVYGDALAAMGETDRSVEVWNQAAELNESR